MSIDALLAFIPLAIIIVTLGLGMSLTVADFTRVAQAPRVVLLALAIQVLVMPALCFGLVSALGMAPELAVGMMLIVAAPGGTTANFFSHLAGGDVALNVTLTAVNSVLSVVTLPIVVNLSLAYFLGDGQIGLQAGKVAQVFALVLVPIGLGMLLRRVRPVLALRMVAPVKIAAAVLLLLLIGLAIYGDRANAADNLAQAGWATLALSSLSLAIGYVVPRLARMERTQAIACSMEIGIHNVPLALAIALSPSLLGNARIAVPVGVYGSVMFITAGLATVLHTRRRRLA
ncbi:bile acid:sodium symporter family protein [Kribbella antibiotica]|uniref:Bile acid:sodium symporter family protein n=1 Tax=Kribbella antibiotica TaxID=190195 RepID=A0A4R4ZP27_9ACTN|nr:bile acid:sodium symporter family protein [Kribbella antibiotica]